MLGVSRDYFDEHVIHELRIVRRGRRILVALNELERWLDRNAARAAVPTRWADVLGLGGPRARREARAVVSSAARVSRGRDPERPAATVEASPDGCEPSRTGTMPHGLEWNAHQGSSVHVRSLSGDPA
jgi:hypothetical protein